MLYFGLSVHIKCRALGPVASLDIFFIKEIKWQLNLGTKKYLMHLGQIINFRSSNGTRNCVKFYLLLPKNIEKI